MEAEGCRAAAAVAAVDSGNPLLRAVFLRRLRLTRLLLEGGAYVNESDGQGQTPLMVACRTQHADAQSASRVRLVQFLLEKGADPNIQDKDGRSALAHACRERAGAKVVALLLAGGADVGLEDRSGTSALVHAVLAEDWKVLRLLLDSCKAKGKEVIIITTDKFPDGRLQAQQHLAPASPSEVHILTSPKPGSSSSGPPDRFFSFKNPLPGAPGGGSGQQQLLRLNSEPWLKIPPSLLAQQPPDKHPDPSADLDHQSADLLLRVPRGAGGGADTNSPLPEGRQLADKERKEPRMEFSKHLGEKTSFRGLLSSHSASHPDLHSAANNNNSKTLHGLAASSLRSIIQRRRLGADIYSSDPQLPVGVRSPPEEPREKLAEGRRLAPLRCCSTLGSREAQPTRRVLGGLERRGSGAFLLEQSAQARPRSLPPLALGSAHAPLLGGSFGEKDSAHKTFFLPAAPPGPPGPPGPPREATRRMLLRRHSMQTEQLKTTA